jgi:hypothetical protein
MCCHVPAFALKPVSLFAQHDAVWSNKDCAEWMIAKRTRLARDVEGASEMLLVVRLRAFDH